MTETIEYTGPVWRHVDEQAAPNAREWIVRPSRGGGLDVAALDDSHAERQTLHVKRDGVRIMVQLPPPPDLSAVKELEGMQPIVDAAWRLRHLGYGGPLPPICVHTETAKRFWPLFEKDLGPMPVAGAAAIAGVTVVWGPTFDSVAIAPP